MAAFLSGASVLITGGTGTLGRVLVPFLLAETSLSRLAILSRDWQKQEALWNELTPSERGRVRFFLGDVCDRGRLDHAFRDVDVVIHAAAMKHIVFGEYNPAEVVRVNVGGALNVIHAGIHAGVKRLLAISTDKAIHPVNVYGFSKALMEKLFVQSNAYAAATPTRLACVRYGNVLGARGSVMDVWDRVDGDLPVTDLDMTRFLITPAQACEFVVRALEEMQGGEVFVPKLPACTVADLAQARHPERSVHLMGIRPGEKMHETLVSVDEVRRTVDVRWAYVVLPEIREWAWDREWEGTRLTGAVTSDMAHRLTVEDIRALLNERLLHMEKGTGNVHV